MQKQMWNREQLIAYAATHYLSHPLPPNWMHLSEDRLMEFVSDTAWQPFEHWEPNQIWELIYDMASSLNQTFILGVDNV
jgi:hypothetical protein